VNRRAFVGGLAVFLLLVGIWPQPLLSLSDHAAAVLVGVTP
jgi:hypothetical protein